MVEWGGHHGGWGGFGPPSYIVKKCPAVPNFTNKNYVQYTCYGLVFFIQPFYKYVLFAGGMQGLQSMMRQFQGAGGMPGGSGHN